MNIPFTNKPMFDDKGELTLAGTTFSIVGSFLLWLGIAYIVYPPAAFLLYLGAAVEISALVLTGLCWFIAIKLVPQILSLRS